MIVATDVVVLSGGLDSTVCMVLAAREGGRPPLGLTFDYGQRHRTELERAAAVTRRLGAEQLVVELDTRPWGGSALTDPAIPVPSGSIGPPAGHRAPSTGPPGGRTAPEAPAAPAIPATYVPARNSIFLAVALGVAEARGADRVWIGVNALDYSGYPDCRPEFVDAFRRVAALGQRRGVEGHPIEIRTPLVELGKSDIVRLGLEVGAPLELTWSCYREEPVPCGDCDACALRARGFAGAGVDDPALARP